MWTWFTSNLTGERWPQTQKKISRDRMYFQHMKALNIAMINKCKYYLDSLPNTKQKKHTFYGENCYLNSHSINDINIILTCSSLAPTSFNVGSCSLVHFNHKVPLHQLTFSSLRLTYTHNWLCSVFITKLFRQLVFVVSNSAYMSASSSFTIYDLVRRRALPMFGVFMISRSLASASVLHHVGLIVLQSQPCIASRDN